MIENRMFQRVRLGVESEIEVNGALYDATLLDISLKGAMLALPDEVVPDRGQACHLMAHLDMSDVTLYFTGVVAHAHDNRVGVKFITIGIDTMIHLRSLLELNSGDPDLVRSELNSFVVTH